jgi:hypothetical protein
MSDEPLIESEAPGAFGEERTVALSLALREKFDMANEDADEIASVVAEQFGGEEEVNDENLDPSVRSIFYTLEAKKIVSFRREEYTTENGERRRGFWWKIRTEELAGVTLVPEVGEEDVYANLPRDVWSARQHA